VARSELEVLQERNQALHADLARTQAQLHSLLEASLAVVSSLTLHDVLQTVLAGVRALFDARAAAVGRRAAGPGSSSGRTGGDRQES